MTSFAITTYVPSSQVSHMGSGFGQASQLSTLVHDSWLDVNFTNRIKSTCNVTQGWLMNWFLSIFQVNYCEKGWSHSRCVLQIEVGSQYHLYMTSCSTCLGKISSNYQCFQKQKTFFLWVGGSELNKCFSVLLSKWAQAIYVGGSDIYYKMQIPYSVRKKSYIGSQYNCYEFWRSLGNGHSIRGGGLPSKILAPDLGPRKIIVFLMMGPWKTFHQKYGRLNPIWGITFSYLT